MSFISYWAISNKIKLKKFSSFLFLYRPRSFVEKDGARIWYLYFHPFVYSL